MLRHAPAASDARRDDRRVRRSLAALLLATFGIALPACNEDAAPAPESSLSESIDDFASPDSGAALSPDPGEAARADPEELRPGDSLLDAPEQLQLLALAPDNLPPEMKPATRALLRRRRLRIAPKDWLRLGPLEDTAQLPVQMAERTDLVKWALRPFLRLDLELGVQFLREDGVEARPFATGKRLEVEFGKLSGWTSPDFRSFYHWSADTGALVYFANKAPGIVDIGYTGATEDVHALLETQTPGELPAAASLVRRVSLQHQNRPALLAPAPSVVERRALLRGDSLRVAVGVLPIGFGVERGVIQRDDDASDGVTFAVEVRDEAGATERLWSHQVLAQDGFLEETVDLSAYTGQRVTLRLLTEPGPADDALADYALWSELRLQGEPRRTPSRPHVLLIDIDTLRADRLGTYGADLDTSPHLDAWAAREAVVYENSRAAATWTLPSTASMLSGLSVTQHDTVDFPDTFTAESLAERLGAAGYETYARVDGGFLTPAFGFASGFDVYDFQRHPHGTHDLVGWKPELLRLATRRSERPLFYFLQTYMVHAPYKLDRRFDESDPPYAGLFLEESMDQGFHKQILAGEAPTPTEEDRVFVRALYDAGVRRMDELVHHFLSGAARVFGDEPYLVVFSSDHGEELFDNGFFGHGHTLEHDQLFVPLIIRYPDAQPARESGPASGLDLVPTILAAVGLELPAHLPGVALQTPPRPERTLFAEHDEAAAVLRDGWRLHAGPMHTYAREGGGLSLRDVSEDPWSQQDVSAEHTKVVTFLQRELDVFRASYPKHDGSAEAAAQMNPALLGQLRELGYLGDDGD